MKVWIFLATRVIWAVAIEVVTANNDDTASAQVHDLEPALIQMFTSGEVEPVYKDNIDTTPIPFYIVSGINGLCLEEIRNAAKIVDCKKDAETQKWNLLEDGTIRNLNDQGCLTANDLYKGGDVLVLPCKSELSKYQRWNHRSSDNTIVNLATQFVMDVANSEVHLDTQHIFIFESNGGNNQKWYLDTV